MADKDINTIVGFTTSLPLPVLLIINAIKDITAPILLIIFVVLTVISFGVCAKGYKRNQLNKNKTYRNMALIGMIINAVTILFIIGYFIFSG